MTISLIIIITILFLALIYTKFNIGNRVRSTSTRELSYRLRVAFLARQVIEDKLDFQEFYDTIIDKGSSKSGDVNVDELLGLIKYWNNNDGLLDAPDEKYDVYMNKIHLLINKLKSE